MSRRVNAVPALLPLLAVACAVSPARAAERFFAYNETATTVFTGVRLAPAGTTAWGANQALNDKDKVLDTSERLKLTGLAPGSYDVQLTDRKGRTCVMKGVDLRQERSFEIRDTDLAACR